MYCVRRALAAGLAIVCLASASHGESTRYRLVLPGAAAGQSVDAETARFWSDWLTIHDYDVAGVLIKSSIIDVILREGDDPARLTALGFTVLEQEASQPLSQKLTQYQESSPRGIPAGFANPAAVEAFLDATTLGHPSITRKFTLGPSVQGRQLWAIEISDQPGVAEDEPAIQFNGLHHAREIATPHVIMDIVTHLTNEYALGNPTVVDWVNHYKIYCVPMVNPDGSNRVFTLDDFHRKNLGTSCVGGNPGIDLNRNYPYHWGSGGANCERSPTGGSSGSCSSDSYRGLSPESEPETKAMTTFAAVKNFVIAVSYHSFGQFIDYPYACNDGNPDMSMPEHAVIDELMEGAADGIFAVDGVTYDVFSPVAIGAVNGDDTSWYYAHNGTYALIIEIGTSFQPSFATAMASVNRNRGGWQYLLSRLGGARIDVRVIDHLTGIPLVAEVELLDFVFDTDELPRFSEPVFGRSRWMVQANQTYTARVSAAGYATRDVDFSVVSSPVDAPVLLLANGETLGDADQDGDTDLIDASLFQQCVGQAPIPPPCRRMDMNADEEVTVDDFASFEALLAGPL